MTVKNIEKITIKLFPQAEKRRLYLELFIEAINHANSHGSNMWGTYCESNYIRLVVGHLIIFTLHEQRVWLALDKQLLESSKEYELQLAQSSSWQWDITGKKAYPEYKKWGVTSRNGYYDFSKETRLEIWPVIKELHFKFIDRVVAKNSCLQPKSQKKHDVDVLNFLQSELGLSVPYPVYHQVEPKYSIVLPKEDIDNEGFFEGNKMRVIVDDYQRNPKARQACLAHYGYSCQVCGLDFGEKYGKVGEGFIHVHHLNPISNIGEEYEIDPIRDLVPVCPNCHAIIHKQKTPYTIEEVKEFLSNAKKNAGRIKVK